MWAVVVEIRNKIKLKQKHTVISTQILTWRIRQAQSKGRIRKYRNTATSTFTTTMVFWGSFHVSRLLTFSRLSARSPILF